MGKAISRPLMFRCSPRGLPNDGFSAHASAICSVLQSGDRQRNFLAAGQIAAPSPAQFVSLRTSNETHGLLLTQRKGLAEVMAGMADGSLTLVRLNLGQDAVENLQRLPVIFGLRLDELRKDSE